MVTDKRLNYASLEDGVVEHSSLPEEGRYVYFVHYPADFTFVCPTEIFDLNRLEPRFKDLGVLVVATSPDSVYTHHAWLQAPTKIRGLGSMVNLRLYSDPKGTLLELFELQSKRSDALYDRHNERVVYRRENPDDVGRNFEDVLRIVESLKALEANPGHYCTLELGSKALPKI